MRRRPSLRTLAAAGLAAAVVLTGVTAAPWTLAEAAPADDPRLAPVDPQDVADLDELTWDDYVATPGTDWADPSVEPTVKRWKAALVLVDFPDQPFIVTQPQGSTPWGNPQLASDVPREDVPQFYADFLNTPNELNRGHTLNEYWMENSDGRYGVELDPVGAFELPKKSYQYFYSQFADGGPAEVQCPEVLECDGNFRADVLAAWQAESGLADPTAEYDNVFFVGAGMDQSAAWLEFGQMKFDSPEDVPDELGPPQEWKDAVKAETGLDAPNWSPTRYVDWTSWKAGASMWPNASGTTSIEAESSGAGVFAHELSHNLSIGDNYGNPYAENALRDASGPWDMMSRGSFNGPGGQHERWHVPSDEGAVMGSQHMLRDKIALGLVDDEQVVRSSQSELTDQGILRARVQARAVQGPELSPGISIDLDQGDTSTCVTQGAGGPRNAWRCDGGDYDGYDLEVVDQMGSDSFTPDSGVLISKVKDNLRANPGKWVIDADVADIDQVDYVTPDGQEVDLTRGDHRQLNDALFKAGTRSGSQQEFRDRGNDLHFYVLDTARDERGVLSYDLAVRSTAGAGEQRRGVSASDGVAVVEPDLLQCTVQVTNTGRAGAEAAYASDVYRISASAAAGWDVVLPYELVAAEPGETVEVTGYAVRESGAAAGAIELKVASESAPGARATASCAG